MKTSVSIEGLNELRIALRRLPEELQKNELAKAVRKGAQTTQADAVARAPFLMKPDPRRKSGLLKSAIKATAGRRNGNVGSAFVYVRMLAKSQISKFKKAMAKAGKRVKGAANPDDPFYWRFVEFGTSKMAAKPFLRPAFEHTKMQAAERIKEALREGVERQAAKVAGRKFK